MQAHILRNAIALFAKDGFDGVSIRQISAKVGVTLATLYHNFPDKQALYDAAVREAFSYVKTRMVEGSKSDKRGEARLRAFMSNLISLQSSDAPEMRLVDRELLEARPQMIAKLGRDLFQAPHDALVTIVEELAPDAPTRDIAEYIIGAAYGAVKLRAVRTHLQNLDHLLTVDGLVESLTNTTLATLRGYTAIAR